MVWRRRRVGAVIASLGLAIWLVRSYLDHSPVLEAAKPQRATLEPGAQHRYALPLEPRDCAFGSLRPWASPGAGPASGLRLSVFSPVTEAPIRRFTMGNGPLEFGFCGESGGRYRLAVRAPAHGGGYQLDLDAVLIRAGDGSSPAPKQSPPYARQLMSPRLRSLREAARSAPRSFEAFWQEVTRRGTPLVERIDDAESWVSFLYRGTQDVRSVAISWPMWTYQFADTQLTRMAGTDLWWKTVKLPSAARLSYQLTIDPPQAPKGAAQLQERAEAAVTRADPYNPRILLPDPQLDAYGQRSVLRLPAAAPERWLRAAPTAARGTLEQHRLRSRTLGHEHKLTVYVPAGERRQRELPLLLFFDGESYLREIPTPRLLDRLIAAAAISPLIAVFVHNDEPSRRAEELPCNATFAAFVASELLPFVRAHYPVTASSEQVGLAGSSFGGLASSYIAWKYPALFGKVLSQSGSYWWSFPQEHPAFDGTQDPGWLRRRYAERPAERTRFYLSAGMFEAAPDADGVLEQNRLQRDALRALGYSVAYQEFVGGHDVLAWRATLPDALIALYGLPP